MNADGTGQTRLTTHPADDEYPTWSSDGRLVAFQTTRHSDTQVWLMRVDGSDQSMLVGPSQPRSLCSHRCPSASAPDPQVAGLRAGISGARRAAGIQPWLELGMTVSLFPPGPREPMRASHRC